MLSSGCCFPRLFEVMAESLNMLLSDTMLWNIDDVLLWNNLGHWCERCYRNWSWNFVFRQHMSKFTCICEQLISSSIVLKLKERYLLSPSEAKVKRKRNFTALPNKISNIKNKSLQDWVYQLEAHWHIASSKQEGHSPGHKILDETLTRAK